MAIYASTFIEYNHLAHLIKCVISIKFIILFWLLVLSLIQPISEFVKFFCFIFIRVPSQLLHPLPSLYFSQ